VLAARALTDLMPLGARWTPEEDTGDFDPGVFEDSAGR